MGNWGWKQGKMMKKEICAEIYCIISTEMNKKTERKKENMHKNIGD